MKIYSSISILLFFVSGIMKAMDEFPSYSGPDSNDIFNFFPDEPLVHETSIEKFIADLHAFKYVKKNWKLKRNMQEKRVKVSSNENIHCISAWQSEE